MAQAIGQQLNLGPQPNFNNLVQHVNAAMDEVFRIPNLPLAGQGDVIVQLLQGIQRDIQQVQRDIQQVQRDIQQVQRDVRHIRAEQDLLPIKLYNSGAREREHFRYPQGVAIAYPPLPRSRDELAHMTISAIGVDRSQSTWFESFHAGRIGKDVYSAEGVFLHLLDGDG
ncbi:uncharacterized protein LAJ45_07561 [Morchella importuna]|uniref:uncharacterized protein n=1 Tax=Morchella importuna TaxID=1174673 RepID=UPI001E8D693A|nr:uncharacterized protein LAJ45_07561 [Morchella importuna]KAH8148458.1 hypothetical protein LAJ45_07561 [Morchella importuna]